MKDPLNRPDRENDKQRYLYLYIGLILGIFIGGFYGIFVTHAKYQETLDDFFNLSYTSKIRPEGEKEIDSIVNEVSGIPNERMKLQKLAEWTIDNFTGVYFEESWETKLWHNEYATSPAYNHKYIGDNLNGYGYDKDGNIRARSTTQFWKDPYWIAYMKTGACEDVAVLFYELANQSGFESRLVCSPASDLGHMWVEVKVNDEWLYADCACYHDYGGIRWLDTREKYTQNCYCLNEVLLCSDRMIDLTEYYVPKLKTEPIRKELIQKITDIYRYWNILS
ncbi:Transglutaminase-like superfamily protein [Methanoculleus chikugoensis]|uniref:Transglutaminase-like superfamily protein n=1 Tax=Methanoculleus chikugoensis TaxID=118126 RepID=A0A1M4MI97_9EURY|nr:transglutaminase domain-containing protein [Methanoculleus chikugoensis]SCL74586.1 Transglutaminase-like superfamily protein [Methanoculleus chikugoensis]